MLEAVADVIRRDGWIQGKMHNGNGHCLLGAIDVAYPDPLQMVACRSLVLERIGDYSSITAWNDDPRRTIEEVLSILC